MVPYVTCVKIVIRYVETPHSLLSILWLYHQPFLSLSLSLSLSLMKGLMFLQHFNNKQSKYVV